MDQSFSHKTQTLMIIENNFSLLTRILVLNPMLLIQNQPRKSNIVQFSIFAASSNVAFVIKPKEWKSIVFEITNACLL